MAFKSIKINLQIIVVSIISVFIIISSITGFVRLPQTYYYGAVFTFGMLLLVRGWKWRLSMLLFAWFLLFCMFSIIFNDPPPYFRAWQRLLAFSVTTIIVTPLFVCEKANELRKQLFKQIMLISSILSVASFVCYFLGINYFTISNEVLAIEAGRFSGLFNHSMILGPIASLSAIYCFSNYLAKEQRSFLLLSISVMCVGSVLFSASRSALGGCVFGLVVAYLRFYRGNISRSLVIGFVVIAIIAALYPLWGGWTEFVVTKQQNNIEAGGMFMSREAIWMTRLTEIRQNFFTGVGFCCVDAGLTLVDTNTGIIEPGSSWLAVFSMTGIFGFLLFFLIYFLSFRHSYSITDKTESCILSGCLSFFGIHLLFEGYVLAVGSFLSLMFWLVIGCVMACSIGHSSSKAK